MIPSNIKIEKESFNMEQNQISVALVGLSFGLEFLPIYLEHPDVKEVWIVEKNESLLKFAQERYGIPAERCTTAYSSVLENPKIDAIHLVTPPRYPCFFLYSSLRIGKTLRLYHTYGYVVRRSLRSD